MIEFILSQIFGFIGGGGVSIVSKWINSKNEQALARINSDAKVKIAMLEADSIKYSKENDKQILEAKLDAETEERVLKLERLIKKPTGNKLIDFLNASVRPFISYYVIGIWAPIICIYYYFINPDEVFVLISTIINLILGFWFTNRNFMKQKEA